MKTMGIIAGMVIALWMVFSLPAHAEELSAKFTSPEGIRFESYSSVWNEDKLKGLYQILLACGHGEELKELKQVTLYPNKSTGKSGPRVGLYEISKRAISIFEVDQVPVERIFIHEYGHHFTYYWLHKKEGIYPESLTETSEWAKIRQLNGYPIRWKGSNLPYIHKWDPEEIMAEDYVLLFGVGGYPPPAAPKNSVYFLRQENDYIPMAEALPEVRRYWEQAAGLTAKQPLRSPKILQWEAAGAAKELESLTQGDSDEVVKDEVVKPKVNQPSTYRIQFSSAAADDSQEIQYGVHVIGFSDNGGLPVKQSTGVISTGRAAVEAQIDLKPFQEELSSFYLEIQIWAIDTKRKQLIYTPVYMNWFQYDGTSLALKPISFPFERQGLPGLFQKEGMKRWPLVQLFINGKPMGTTQRMDDGKGTVYLPLKALDDDAQEHSTPPSKEVNRSTFKFQFQKHDIQFQLDQDQVLVDGKSVKLRQRIKRIENEPAMPISELQELLGVTMKWDEAGSSLFVETL